METQVVGGGPVGLFAAICLHEQGVEVGVLDAEWERPVRSYACGLHPETLRLLERLGMMPAIQDVAHRVDQVFIWRGNERAGCADLRLLPGPYPHVLTLSQSDLQDILAQRLAQLGVEVSLRQEVVGLTLTTDAVCTVAVPRMESGTASSRPIRTGVEPTVRRSDYVIAADGYESVCRRALGIPLLDQREAQVFSMFEFEADLGAYQHEAHVVLGAESVATFWPLGPGLGRWSFQMLAQLDETPTLELLQELLREQAPWFRSRPEQLCWATTSHFERRVTERFGAGRVWLAGDSAHVTSPLGFQNMNRGFSEANELARIISQTLQGRVAAVESFERFEYSQQLEWRRLQGGEAMLSTGALYPGDGQRLAACLPASGSDLDNLLGQLQLGVIPQASRLACDS